MSRTLLSPARLPPGMDRTGRPVDDRFRPGLRQAFPLPQDDGGDRFRRLIEALSRQATPRPASAQV